MHNMVPTLKGFDHIHVYVRDRASSEKWYADVMELKRDAGLLSWAKDGGPLTLQDPSGAIHIALFERKTVKGSNSIAFGASSGQFLQWKTHLEDKGLELRLSDHDMAYSLYFSDLDENMYEITTYQPADIRAALS